MAGIEKFSREKKRKDIFNENHGEIKIFEAKLVICEV